MDMNAKQIRRIKAHLETDHVFSHEDVADLLDTVAYWAGYTNDYAENYGCRRHGTAADARAAAKIEQAASRYAQ